MTANGGLSTVRMLSVTVIVLTAMVLFPLRMVSARKAPPNCVVGGPCELCAGLELSHESCRATKRRQEYICRGGLPDDDVEDETGARGDSVSTTKKAKNNDEDDDSSSSSSSSSSNNRARRSALEQHLDQHHARLKGRRIKAEPLDEEDEEESAAVVIYRSCERTADDDVRAVIWFEVWMAVIGGLSMWGVHTQKTNNQTLYDKRLHKKSSR